LAESATLAAIIQSPNRLSPHRNPERAVERRNLVLELMRKQGRIDLAAFEQARSESLDVSPVTVERGESRYFLDALRRQLPELYDQSVLEVEGLRIYSTLDPRLQRAATKALREGIEAIERRKPELRSEDPTRRLQGCLLAMRPQTGEILALVGGRSYGDSQFDRCTQARRPAGSVFKPFVYAAALEPRGGAPVITLASILDDTPLEVETRQGLWQPANYDHEFRGPVPVREALERSLNVPSARLAMDVGIGRVADMARRLGITSKLPHVYSLALGTADVAPIELARAYATLANGGIRPVPHTFEDVVSAGQTLERRTLGFERVLDPGTAFLTVSLREGVVARGTARRLRAMGFRGPIAGKTGTTDEEHDLWFVGFTPELVAVVWLGFDEPRSIGVSSSQGPLPIWASFARDAFGTRARGAFLPPADVEQLEIEPETGALALSGCRTHRPEYFLEGTGPSETCPRGREVGGSGGGSRRGLLRWLGDLL
jgi:penicillin-binding protein 1B